MKISIVTAVFNRRATIAEALDSVAEQSHSCIDHIVQDGGSTDGTAEIIEGKNYKNLSYVSECDTGIYDAINRGIKRASGDVIGLMHSDDFFADPYVIERVANTFSDPEIDGVYGDLDYVSSNDPGRIIRRWRSGTYSPDLLSKGWMPPHPTLYLRREVFDKYGLYDTSYRISADYDAILRFLAVGKIRLAYIPQVLVKMRAGGESNRSLAKIVQKSREDYRAIRKNRVGGLGTLTMKNLSKIRQFF